MRCPWFYSCLFVLLAILPSCKKENITPDIRLSFSADTLRFDTVFTTQSSYTKQVIVYNPTKSKLTITQISLSNGNCFQVNVDGENDASRLNNIQLDGGDSLFVFVKVSIPPTGENDPVFFEEHLTFQLASGGCSSIVLQANAQDVEVLTNLLVRHDSTLLGEKPYLVFGYLAVDSGYTLTINQGTTIYFHDEAQMVVYGSVCALGTLDHPIRMRGDRLDDLFSQVPYDYVAGRWGGLYLIRCGQDTSKYVFDHFELNSPTIGMYAYSEDVSLPLAHLSLTNSRIHNCSKYGLVAQNIDADVTNCEISNAASYCVYLAGGEQNFVHTTIASYFNNTNVRIQSTAREDVAALYINNLNKSNADMQIDFHNCIITGLRSNNIVLATPFEYRFPGEFSGNYIKTDSASFPCKDGNRFAADNDEVFLQTYYEYKVYNYYDFRLNEKSPARGIADSVYVNLYPTDRLGNERKADAGCYEYQ